MVLKSTVKERRAVVRRNEIIFRAVDFYFGSMAIQSGVFGVTAVSCIWYISGAYSAVNQSTMLDSVFFSVFLLDYILCIIAVDKKYDYCVSSVGLANLVSMIPLFGILIPAPLLHTEIWPSGWMGFLRFFRMMNVFQLTRSSSNQTLHCQKKNMRIALSKVNYRIGRLCVSILVLILVSAGVVFSVTLFEEKSFRMSSGEDMTWFDCLYFTVVTVTTVGD